ncbi:V-set and immunoglobulin domain-containing protein 10-like [Sceloporus undulatus]|uniref:V-set and immunoglobulin domain-containing protein 10-like n=1 Tax=Sceloporus undulatus TaxID=8520 RepID=UPI001C4BE8DE|nr:V-set and immunoglobulin domain-containing protein 10-like [Sceloporus undulatus]
MASWYPGTCLSSALTGWLLSLLVPLLPALLSSPLAVRVGDSVSLSIPFPLPSFQIQTTIIWRKDTTILAIGTLHPNFTVVVAPSFRPQFSVDPWRGNLNITAVTTSNSGIYTVEIFPLGNSVQKENFTVQVYEDVGNVFVSPPSAEATEGDSSVALNCTPVRGSVSWTKDGQSLGDNPRYLRSAGYLQIRSPQRMDTGTYHCSISNPFSNGTGIANLTVYYGPETPTITISSSDQDLDARSFVLVNSTVNLTCLAPSEPQARIYWNVADIEDPDVPSLPVLQLSRVQLNQAGPYSCLAINQRTQKRVRNTVNLKVAQQPSGSPRCAVISADNGTALLFICSWLGGYPAPHLSFQGLPGNSKEVSASNLQQPVVSPFPSGLSGKTITCLGRHLTKKGNCSMIPEAPSGVLLSFQVHSNDDGPVAVELHCQGIFNPVEIEWFRDKKSLSPTSGHYQLSPDRTRFTIWNFTAPQELGDYSATCSNPLGSQQSNITITGPAISNWTLSHGPHPGSVYLEWTIPKGSVVTGFWIQMQSPKQSRSGEEWKTVEVLGATNRSATIVGLEPQTPYSFQIVPRLGSQAGNASYVQNLQPPVEHLSGGAIAGIVIGSIFGMLLIIVLLFLLVWLIWLTCRRRAKNTKVPLENQQHYLSRQFPNGNKLESNDPSWRNSCWSSGDSDIYAITYEKHLCKYGSPTSLPISTMDCSFPLPAPQPGPRHVRSATQV